MTTGSLHDKIALPLCGVFFWCAFLAREPAYRPIRRRDGCEGGQLPEELSAEGGNNQRLYIPVKRKYLQEVPNMRVKITLACTECKQRNYCSKKNKKNDPDRLEMNKYCKFCRKHTLHRETK